MTSQYICIEGNIGSGKTTLSKMLARSMNSRLVLEEFEENPFLARFYEEPEKYSFPLEMSFLADRYRQLKENLSNEDLFQPNVVADYSPFKSLIFARTNLIDREYKLYREFFDIVYHQLKKPDLVVYLYRPVNSLMNNIMKRGRNYELKITLDYLEGIHKSYMTYFQQNPEVKVLKINASNMDFVDNNEHFIEIQNSINQYFNKNEVGL